MTRRQWRRWLDRITADEYVHVVWCGTGGRMRSCIRVSRTTRTTITARDSTYLRINGMRADGRAYLRPGTERGPVEVMGVL